MLRAKRPQRHPIRQSVLDLTPVNARRSITRHAEQALGRTGVECPFSNPSGEYINPLVVDYIGVDLADNP